MGSAFIAGKLSYVDFFLYEILKFIEVMDRSLFVKYPKLGALTKRFENLDGVRSVMKTEEFKKCSFMPLSYLPASFK